MGESCGNQCERCNHCSNECFQCGLNYTNRVEQYRGLDGQIHTACNKTIDNGIVFCRLSLTPKAQ